MNAMTFEEQKAFLLLNRLLAGRRHGAREFLDGGMPGAELVGRIRDENYFKQAEALRELRDVFCPDREIEECAKKGIRILNYGAPDYPERLKQISDPPLVLYVKGHLARTDRAAVAVVGSRHASHYGWEQAGKIAAELAAGGCTVVSGLARGIDQSTHEGALRVTHGRTLAVLGCGADVIYPARNRDLYEKISERGAVISEYALGAAPLAHHFPIRNRIISGLSLGVLVVEAHVRSGSLITAREALDQGRDVFALPGRVDQLTSRGCHQLLKEGAYLAESAQDILSVLAFPLRMTVASEMPSEEEAEEEGPRTDLRVPEDVTGDRSERHVMEVLSSESMTPDEIAHKSGVQPGILGGVLLALELKKKIARSLDNRFSIR